MKNVYLVQPNNALSKSLFLPYSIGTIAAYSFQFEEIKENYRLGDFLFTKTPINEAVNEFADPFIVGFSNYLWNVEYNLALARAIKEKWNDCIIAFGGPQIPDDTEYLEEYSFIDVLMHGEGEITFYSLLKKLQSGDSFAEVNNISYRDGKELIHTEKKYFKSLDDFPSPYTMGLFDKILKDKRYEGVQFDAVVETNRGCPYSCIYCCWSDNGSSFRAFPIERVKGDFEWISKNKVAYCICADANFGMLERDEDIADYVVELKKKHGYPERFETIATKNKDDLTFRINSKLESVGLNRGISLAVQSMSPEVLENIGRKNMGFENFSKQLEMYRQSGICTYTDLILALPGETLESFCKGLFDVIEAGQHDWINVNRFEFFPNTRIYSKEMVEKYKIKTIRSFLCQNHTKIGADMEFGSRSELVVETSTMSMNDWRTALRVSFCAQSFHGLGLLRIIAMYLRKSENVSYYDFYMNLYDWIENESVVIKRILDKVAASVDTFLKGQDNLHFSDRRFGDIYWAFEEGLYLCCVAELEDFYKEIESYIVKYFKDEELFEDILKSQKALIPLPSDESSVITLKYDWHEYFKNIYDSSYKVLTKKELRIKTEASGTDNWEDYAREIVWYGKRSGRTISKGNILT